MADFDLMVIGGGPAGYLAAERAGAAGLKTAVAEKAALGGVCLNEGCIPSKTLLNSAKIYTHALHGEAFGVTASGLAIDHARVVERKDRVVKRLVAGVAAKMKKQRVQVLSGTAAVKGRGDDGFVLAVDGAEYTASRVLLATGSVPVVPDIPGVQQGLKKGYVLTSREMLQLTRPPRQLVVVGGGVVGLEMAAYFSAIGCKVAVVEMLDKIAGPVDDEIAALLMRQLETNGVAFYLGCRLTAVSEEGVTFEGRGGTRSVPADKVLLSIGRRPSAQVEGFSALGLQLEKGAVATDARMRTNIASLWAAGDVNGKSMLAHTAYREAEVAVDNMLGGTAVMRYGAVPAVVYTTPEVACVGLTEQQAKDRGIAVKIARLPLAYAGRYLAETEKEEGLCKLVVDARRNTLLGVHIMGSYASEMIYGAALMLELELRVQDVKELVFPHPTVSEIIKETLFELG